MQQRGLPGAELTLFALCLSLLLSNTHGFGHGAECTRRWWLPCSFGGCKFYLDANGFLDRTGSCPSQGGTLDLHGQGIKGLREDVFSNMSACERLYLGDNDLYIGGLRAAVFNGLTNLKYLDLEYNELPNLPEAIFNGLTNLKDLTLRWNGLTALSAVVFNGLTNLEVLKLSYNKLAALPAAVFNGLKNLKTLYLSKNELTGLPAAVFDDLTNLR